MERTFVLLKPDAHARGLVGVVLARFEAKGLRVVTAVTVQPDRDMAAAHYREHAAKDYFGPLCDQLTSGPVTAAVLEGPDACAAARRLLGPCVAPPAGTIRGDMAAGVRDNLAHAADSQAAAERASALWLNQAIHSL